MMGKSSSGKDTIYGRLINDSELPLETIVGYTTRPMREGEENGREYYFTDEEGLEYLEKSGKVIEKRGYNTVHGMWYYFTVDDENVDPANKSYLLIGTLESYRKVREYYGGEVVVPIYINVEDGTRLLRAVTREKQEKEPKYQEVCRRFLADSKDFADEILDELDINKRYENDELDRCYREIKEDIKKAL